MSDTQEAQFDPEVYFPPRPGGFVDTARKQAAANQSPAAEPVTRSPRPVTVKVPGPDLFAAKTITIAAGVSALAAPLDPDRNLIILNFISTAGSVIIARDRSGADTGTGFYLQAGQPMIPLTHTREVWLHNPGSQAVQVSVLTESYTRV